MGRIHVTLHGPFSSPICYVLPSRSAPQGILINAHTEKYRRMRTHIYQYLWTDSMTVLHWISNRKAWKQYVQQHRVSEIRELTDVMAWNFCLGVLNPADYPSKGL